MVVDFISVPWYVENCVSSIARLVCVASAIILFNDVTYLQCITFFMVKLLQAKSESSVLHNRNRNKGVVAVYSVHHT